MATIRAVRELLALKDQNGRTPYDLAVHKNKPAVAAVLKAQALALQRMSNPAWQWQQFCSWENVREICQLRTWKVWLGLPEVDDVDESPRFPFYYVCAHLVCHFLFTFMIFIPLFNITEGVLWDYMLMLSINTSLIFISAYTLYRCHTTNPGRLDASYDNIQLWRRLYEQTLDAFASSDEGLAQTAAAVQLCHTCHIARPPRSKHDRFSRACILQFDHHCPFVGTTVGLYNYKWFFGFILAVSVYYINFLILLIVYYRRTSIHTNSYFILMFGLYLGLHILFSGGMVIYHSQLVFANLTTNEHLNMNRYDYLWKTTHQDGNRPAHRIFYNPWNRGCCNNMYDRFVDPGDRSYLVPTGDARDARSSSIELHQPLIRRGAETV
jgi:palmitoyltransferase ZDHHC13/17